MSRLARLATVDMWSVLLTTPNEQVIELRPEDRSKFWADPFLVPGSNGRRLLCEEFDYRTALGQIVELSLDGDYSVADVRPCFPSDQHQSYPHTFVHDGDVYVIPEMAERGMVPLFRRSGSAWTELDPLLPDYAGLDSTLMADDQAGDLWLVTTPPDRPESAELFMATDLFGTWHSRGLLAEGSYGARSAGRAWCEDGRWLRPAQDSSTRYGGGIVIKAIAEDGASETVVEYIGPPAGFEGTHTIDRLDGYCVVDAVKRVSIAGSASYLSWRVRDLQRRIGR